jgi:hypothetical protein
MSELKAELKESLARRQTADNLSALAKAPAAAAEEAERPLPRAIPSL